MGFGLQSRVRLQLFVYFVEDGKPVPDAPLFAFDSNFDTWDDDDVQIHAVFTMPPQTSGVLCATCFNLNGGAAMTLETQEDYETRRQRQDLQFSSVVGLTLGLVIITAALC